LHSSGVAKWAVRENERISRPPPWTLSRFTVPLPPRGLSQTVGRFCPTPSFITVVEPSATKEIP
jgi:hypothetical protein